MKTPAFFIPRTLAASIRIPIATCIGVRVVYISGEPGAEAACSSRFLLYPKVLLDVFFYLESEISQTSPKPKQPDVWLQALFSCLDTDNDDEIEYSELGPRSFLNIFRVCCAAYPNPTS